ncbi:MAG: glycoside hydrolase family 97 catalytic domain-containing protein [Bacteroidales bacterium]|nr:glycoside hydrolase family 97 catalytic domain-containing protein [Bacteroidales bacterium]
MKKYLSALCLSLLCLSLSAAPKTVTSPDGKLTVTVSDDARYSVSLDGKDLVLPSALGFRSNRGDFMNAKVTEAESSAIHDSYTLDRIKKGRITYDANVLTCTLENEAGDAVKVEFCVSDNDVAFRYVVDNPRWASIRIFEEATSFVFPENTTTFLTPQSDAMIGWQRTKPSYEEFYAIDKPMSEKSQYGHGYTFPCLFKIGGDGWALVSETGVDSRYCGGRLSDWDPKGGYRLEFPMPEENDGNGTVEPAFAVPGATPWRTITVGSTLKPIAESTVTWDVVEPRYVSKHNYKFGKGTWSWILWQDGSINYDDQVKFIDLAAAMDFQYVLVDNFWDRNIGYDRMEELVKYAHSKGVDVFLWYSSSGYWNDISQCPLNKMDSAVERKKEMKWLQDIGVKGIKVDFFGGDKQETMRIYEGVLSDADDYGLMVIFHGCTLPRGWERMYPNYVGSEAVRASENLVFGQHECDIEAQNATLHPFIRNAVGCMEFGGCFLNKFLNKANARRPIRRTTDEFELATAVLFQNPIQNFALAPNNLEDAPAYCLDFLRDVPTTWDDIRYIDGYPGKYAVIARRKGGKWYVSAINAAEAPYSLDLKAVAAELGSPASMTVLHGGLQQQKAVDYKAKAGSKAAKANLVEIAQNDGAVIIIIR